VRGKQNVQNLLAAILVAKELNMSMEEIAEAIKDIKEIQAGMTLKEGKHGINIIDSSYSANPDGVLADLDYLSVFPKKKVVVMPCLIELGKKSIEVHKSIGLKIGSICDLAIITTQERFLDIKIGALESGMKEKDIIFCENSDDIYSIITLFCEKGDTVLLEGRVPSKLINLLTG
jgi:UDP-N-acetylmuramoyl-tripeptide--D-alanyl-D-alanine ligase